MNFFHKENNIHFSKGCILKYVRVTSFFTRCLQYALQSDVGTVATKILFNWFPLTKYTVAAVATIAEECVSIYRYRRWNTFFDDSGDSSNESDNMETGLKLLCLHFALGL